MWAIEPQRDPQSRLFVQIDASCSLSLGPSDDLDAGLARRAAGPCRDTLRGDPGPGAAKRASNHGKRLVKPLI